MIKPSCINCEVTKCATFGKIASCNSWKPDHQIMCSQAEMQLADTQQELAEAKKVAEVLAEVLGEITDCPSERAMEIDSTEFDCDNRCTPDIDESKCWLKYGQLEAKERMKGVKP